MNSLRACHGLKRAEGLNLDHFFVCLVDFEMALDKVDTRQIIRGHQGDVCSFLAMLPLSCVLEFVCLPWSGVCSE